MIISMASGKGGTGKTTVATNLALALRKDYDVQFLDCDVEEPNAHIFLKPHITHVEPAGILVPRVDESKCNYCGECARICAFNALAVIDKNVLVFEQMCHGCGGCTRFCPESTITEVNRQIGVVESGNSFETINFIHGRLNPGEAMSPPLIDFVKDNIMPDSITIIDAPPGTSCPVVASVKNSDCCILVTEPTPFGLNDLELAVQMLRKLGIPAGIVINRSDTGDNAVEEYCRMEELPILLRIPWSREVATLYAKGEPVINHLELWENMFVELYNSIKSEVTG